MADTIADNILKSFTPPADLHPRFIYLRSATGHLVATVGVCPTYTDSHAIWAIATCNPKDNFSKQTGRLLVSVRLAKKRHVGLQLRGPGLYRRVITSISHDKTRFCHYAIAAAHLWLTNHPEPPTQKDLQ